MLEVPVRSIACSDKTATTGKTTAKISAQEQTGVGEGGYHKWRRNWIESSTNNSIVEQSDRALEVPLPGVPKPRVGFALG
jgi:hypothetical protein